MESTWETRELRVLDYLVEHYDKPQRPVDPSVEHLSEVTALDKESVRTALAHLFTADPPYITGMDVAEFDYPARLSGVTERARRAVGQWPTPESLADRIIAALEAQAESEPDPETRSKLKHASDVGKGVLTGELTRVLTEGM